MGAKVTRVTLECGSGVQDFELSHAERLLNMRNNGGWKLPDNSEYEFKDNVISRRSKKADKRAKEA